MIVPGIIDNTAPKLFLKTRVMICCWTSLLWFCVHCHACDVRRIFFCYARRMLRLTGSSRISKIWLCVSDESRWVFFRVGSAIMMKSVFSDLIFLSEPLWRLFSLSFLSLMNSRHYYGWQEYSTHLWRFAPAAGCEVLLTKSMTWYSLRIDDITNKKCKMI